MTMLTYRCWDGQDGDSTSVTVEETSAPNAAQEYARLYDNWDGHIPRRERIVHVKNLRGLEFKFKVTRIDAPIFTAEYLR